jgi:hypothetical protein
MADRFRQWFPGQCFAVNLSQRRRCMNHSLSGADLCQLHSTREQAGKTVERIPSMPANQARAIVGAEIPELDPKTLKHGRELLPEPLAPSSQPPPSSVASVVVRGFRIFRRQDPLPLDGAELGAAVWFCSDETVDTFGVVVVGRAAAEHFKVGDRFKLVPDDD